MMRLLDLWWWLRSTMGSYGRPVLEAAYGKIAISLYRGCLGDVSSRRVVGVSTWCITHGRHTRVNTSVGGVNMMHHPWSTYPDQHQCGHSICIFDFKYKTYTYYVLKSICIIKGHWWSLTLSWPDDDQGMISTTHDVFLKEMEESTDLLLLLFLRINWFTYLSYLYACMILLNNVLDLLVISMVRL